MSSPETADSRQVKLVDSMTLGVKKKDLNLFAKQLHKDYRRITSPRFLGVPDQTREQFLKSTLELMDLWAKDCEVINSHSAPCSLAKSHLQPIIHSITELPGKVFIHVCTPNVQTNTTVLIECLPLSSQSRWRPQLGWR